MNLLAYWRFDNYRRDLDEGAGFNFNSKQPRLHTETEVGDKLWLVTRVVGKAAQNEYRLLAQLIIRSKTINSPGYKYGPFRVWGDLKQSAYFRVREVPEDDVFELLRLLPLMSGTLSRCTRENLAQSLQTMRGLTPKAAALLDSFAGQLPLEMRALAIVNELEMERTIYRDDQGGFESLVREMHTGVSDNRRDGLLKSYSRNRQLVADINALYAGRCQICGFDSPLVYGAESAEAHHIVYRSRGGEDIMENLLLTCPNHHTVIHRADATFDYSHFAFYFPNGRVEPINLNKHL